MHTIINSTAPSRRKRASRDHTQTEYRKPSYDCREQPDTVKLVVYVPCVNASGISIEVRGPDLIVTARKPHVVRVNWQALHLEAAQRDYRLRLRMGNSLDYSALQAELHEGVLTLTLPKRQPMSPNDQILNVA